MTVLTPIRITRGAQIYFFHASAFTFRPEQCSVHIEMIPRAGQQNNLGSFPGRRKHILSLHQNIRTGCGSYQWVPRTISRGIQRPGRKAGQTRPS